MGLYKVTGPTPVGDAMPGTTATLDLTATDEFDLLANGRLAIVPRPYKALVLIDHDNEAVAPGGQFDAAFTVGQEQALLESGAIEHAKPSKPTKTPADKPADPKE